MSKSAFRTAVSLATFALASAWSLPALAQDSAATLPQDAEEDATASPDIVVTGSLIRGTPDDSAARELRVRVRRHLFVQPKTNKKNI